MKRLSKIDALGAPFEFSFKKDNKFRTGIGGILTILLFGVIALFTYEFIRNYFDSTNPDVSTSSEISDHVPIRHLYDNKYSIALALFLSPDRIIPVEELPRFITPIATVYELQTENYAQGIVRFQGIEVAYYKPCKDITDTTLTDTFLKANSILAEYSGRNLLCPDVTNPKEFYTQSNASDPPYRMIEVHIYPCVIDDVVASQNGGVRPVPSLCASEGELLRSYINFGFVQTSFVPSNKKNPLKRVPQLMDFRIGLEQELRYIILLKGTELYDDEWDFQEKSKIASFIDNDSEIITIISRPRSITCHPSQFEDQSCRPYAGIFLRSSGKILTIIRKYPKFLATLGEIGGTAELIIVLASFFYCWYNGRKMREFKANKVLGHDLKEYKQVFTAEDDTDQDLLDRVAGVMVDQRDDIIRLHHNQRNWEVWQNMIFDEHHKILLPLVLLNIEKKKQEYREKQGLVLVKQPTQYEVKTVTKMQQAYHQLNQEQPDNPIKQIIHQYFLEHLPEEIKNPSQISIIGDGHEEKTASKTSTILRNNSAMNHNFNMLGTNVNQHPEEGMSSAIRLKGSGRGKSNRFRKSAFPVKSKKSKKMVLKRVDKH